MNRMKSFMAVALLVGVSAFTLQAQEQYAASPADLVRGTVAGVRVSAVDGNPDGLRNVNIRGLNTLRGDSQPLWIVDGVMLGSELTRNLDGFWQFGESSYSAPLNSIPFLNPAEIESIEVLKDISATALYGAMGANGVIIIRTKRAQATDPVLYVKSNAGIGLPSQTGLKAAVVHNHSFGVSALADNTAYRVTGYYRHQGGVVDNAGSDQFTVSAGLETKANPHIWFGINTIASMGQTAAPGSTAYFGHPSTLLLARYPEGFEADTVQGWAEDFDDDSRDWRAVTSAYLTLNFTPTLKLHTTAGVDFQDNRRLIWFGKGTGFGAASNGAASSLSTVLLSTNVKSELNWKQYVAGEHLVNLSAAAEVIATQDKFNTMNGLDFFNHSLRAKGIAAAGSHPEIHRFAHDSFHHAYYVRGEYAYKDIAGIDGTFRADFNPRFRDARPVFYPSASAWVALAGIKFKGGWGIGGREYRIPYELTSSWLRSDYPEAEPGSESFYESLNTLTSREWNVGLEAGLLGKRVLISAQYYNKSTVDAFDMFLSGVKGQRLWNPAPRKNILSRSATIDNRGLEFDLDARLLDSENQKLRLFATAAFNVNQIAGIGEEDVRGLNVGGGSYVNVNVVGHQSGEIFGYTASATGTPADITADGKVTEADRVILGKAYPELFGSVGAQYSFKGFSVKMLWDAAAGHSLVNMNRMLEDGVDVVTDNYVEKADYLRLSNLSVDYALDVRRLGINKVFKELKMGASAANLLTLTTYKGWNPDVNSFGVSVLSGGIDYGSFPVIRTVMLGISASF